LAAIAKERLAQRQVSAYRELGALFEFFGSFQIAPFDQAAADRFESLQVTKIRIATRDLKIAAISLANNALLLTANRRDFEKVPGLRFENWLE
jgi:tRNA(fMet)-specific endonuclease VapC